MSCPGRHRAQLRCGRGGAIAHSKLHFVLYSVVCCTQKRFSVFLNLIHAASWASARYFLKLVLLCRNMSCRSYKVGTKPAWGGSSGAHVYTGVKKEDREEESSAEVSRIYTTRKPTIIDLFEDAGKNREKGGHR